MECKFSKSRNKDEEVVDKEIEVLYIHNANQFVRVNANQFLGPIIHKDKEIEKGVNHRIKIW